MATTIPEPATNDSTLDAALDWLIERQNEIDALEALMESVRTSIRSYCDSNGITEHRTAKAQVALEVKKDTIARSHGYDEGERIAAVGQMFGEDSGLIVRKVDEKALLKRLGRSVAARGKYPELGFDYRKGARTYVFSGVNE